jgi:DNA-directed RNA polymerase subunit RPC12/RpoP
VTIGLARGVNALGHVGWITVRCRICGRYLDLSGQKPGARHEEVVYACPKCMKTLEAYFCAADAKKLGYRCPYCGTQLTIVTPLIKE